METFLNIAGSFFPKPRNKFKWLSITPLVLFLLTFSGLIIYLLTADKVIFSKPVMFWMLAILPWFWWMGVNGWGGITGFRAGTSIFVRLMLAGTFIALLADPRTVRPNDTLSVMYAVDLSDSIGSEMRDNSLQFMASTVEKRQGDMEAGLLVFGREAAVELPPRKSFPFERVTALTSMPKDGTDIEKGLSLAAAMIPEENSGRIVLISDGTSTSGNLDKVLDELKIRKIPVDVLPVQFDYKDEVWLEKLQLPVNVRIGETYEASVILSSLQEGKGTLAIYENDDLLHEEEVTFKAGKNRYSMPLHLRNAGYYEYRAVIKLPPGKDGWKENNLAVNSLYLQGKGKVLLVTHPNGDPRDWRILSEAIKTSKREVSVIEAFEVPRDSLKLQPYDCIIFVNVPSHELDAAQMQACHDAVCNQGSGFLMVGGPDSFGPGGYHNTSIEELLPVDMDITNRKVMPKGALVVILHTCEFPDGNSWAKTIAKASIKVLSSKDEAGLLAWDISGDSWIFPLTPVSKYETMVQKINNCEPADMPSFVGTMEMALSGLKTSDASQKHVIIISDGDPSPPSATLLNKFKAAKITISTVCVDGFHQGQFIKPMQLIAGSTGGRFYHPKDPKMLPRIFIKEAQTLKK
ncbi:MAG: VWA domain-containing protein, partial [Lentisphaeraceae bacterium]|nr:VWA domain-containing protein [Lentisphaeraceae bacterium]